MIGEIGDLMKPKRRRRRKANMDNLIVGSLLVPPRGWQAHGPCGGPTSVR